jgi:peptide/nickel transport system substrate-binding protein
MNRRKFLELTATSAAGLALAACSTSTAAPAATAEVKEVTRVVEVAGTPQVEVVTATPAPAQKLQAEAVLGVLPRSETVISDILTGRCGTPSNFNEWVGWKNRDRGMQTLANEPFWSVDFANGEIINGSADGDPKYNEDFTTCEVPLRKGTTWADGEPFTAADVVFTIELLIKLDGFNDHSFFKDNVKSVTAKDDNTVVFELNQSNSRFHTKFLDRWGCTWIMPKHIFEKVDDPITFEFNPFIGTGAYKLHSFDDQGMWTIWEKRADWDKSPTGILYGEPKPKYVVYQHFANEGAKILAQLTHTADQLGLSSDGLKALLAQSKSSRAYQLQFPWVVNNDPCITGIAFNCAKAPYDNREVRWALLLAIEIVEYMGIAVDATGTLSPVHVPHLAAYPKYYIEPMQDWLKAFTLDLGNGETFAPYDPEAPKRLVEYAKSRGYTLDETPEGIAKAFGLGWYKYSPETATKLLEKNGFKKDKDGKWQTPDGKPWKIPFLCGTQLTTDHGCRNAAAAVNAWQKFGIDAEIYSTENGATLQLMGDWDVAGSWPAQEPWGAGADLYRVLDMWNSAYKKPIGVSNNGFAERWSTDNMDAIIKKLRETDPTDTEAVVAVGIEGLKEAINEMPGIPTYGYIGFVGWDTTYWTNWPGAENAYTQPYSHWGPFKYMMPRLQATGA